MSKIGSILISFSLFAAPALAQQTVPAAQPPAQTAAARADSGKETVVEEIAARVNNAIITRTDIERANDDMAKDIRQQNPPNVDAIIAQRSKDQLRDLINQQLLIQKGQDDGITADTELVKRLDEVRKQVGANSMEDLEKAAEQQGVSFEDFKNNLRNQIITQMVISRDVGGKVQITPTEVKAYYEQHKADFERPEQIRLSEILVPVTGPKDAEGKEGPVDDATVAAAQAKADALEADLKKGTPFDELAKNNSAGPTAAQGGDLGYFKRGMLAKQLEDQTFALQAGGTTPPIRTKQGFVILRVTEHTPAGVPDLKQVENQIQEKLYYSKLDPALKDFINKLREDAYIDVKPGYDDTGTIASQSKPEFSDQTAPKTEAKNEQKKKKKFLIF